MLYNTSYFVFEGVEGDFNAWWPDLVAPQCHFQNKSKNGARRFRFHFVKEKNIFYRLILVNFLGKIICILAMYTNPHPLHLFFLLYCTISKFLLNFNNLRDSYNIS